jgi:hypothetical protein
MDRGSEASRLHRCRLGRESIRQEEHIRRNLQPWVSCSFLVQQETEISCTSSAEAEYMAASQAACEAIWMRKILVGLFGQRMDPTVIYCDNQSCIKLSENPVFHDRSKHMISGIIISETVWSRGSCCCSTFRQRSKMLTF